MVRRDAERERADRVHTACGRLPVCSLGEGDPVLEWIFEYLPDPRLHDRRGDPANGNGDCDGRRILNGVEVDSEAVYGYNASLDAWYAGTPNGSGQTVFELPVASYQFLAIVHGNYYMGSNTCTFPGCASYTVTVPALVTVTVKDANGVKLDNELVYAYNGVADAWVGGILNGSGQTVFMLPAGSYRFLAVVNGGYYWSGTSDTCTTPGCASDTVTVPAQVTVSVKDLNGTALNYEAVYAYNAVAGAWYAGTLNGNGQTMFTLPVGSYQFLVLMDGNYYWGSNTCDLARMFEPYGDSTGAGDCDGAGCEPGTGGL